jgi:hypothetical protein
MKLLDHCGHKIKIVNEIKKEIVEILQRGRKCYWDKESNSVVEIGDEDEFPKEEGKLAISPPESVFVFKLMEGYTAQLEDFEKQSELMESLSFGQPFANFRERVFRLRLNDDWHQFREAKFLAWLDENYAI